MITKQSFINILNAVKSQEKIDDGITSAISSFMCKDNHNNWYNTELNQAIIRILEEEVNDIYDSISYYIYDLNWGTDLTLSITDKDSNDITPRSLGELYDFIKDSNK